MTKKPLKPPPTLPRRPLYERVSLPIKEIKEIEAIEATESEILTAVRAAAEGSVKRNKGPRLGRQSGKVTTAVADSATQICLRIPDDLLKRVDDHAAVTSVTRSEAIRRILKDRLG